ncbi:DNA helicase II / ATP-dependent DNA helicase PcrA (fragment) [groundwater metagenome]|uniref:DNA helicase II / ATP-dependent DNA helicase PcrA n=1 Tax=groundwater metagenome TaxID=717931 RepID=A0A098EEK9_9ZZZZ
MREKTINLNSRKLLIFFENKDIERNLNTDDTLLVVNYRSNSKICVFSNKIFPQQKSTSSGQNTKTDHDGVFLVRENNIEEYCKKYPCTILREKKAEYPEWNWGKSKGLDFDRVLIYPTKNIEKWIKNNNIELAPSTRCKFYVAATRAKHSVAIVYDYNDDEEFEGIIKWKTE